VQFPVIEEQGRQLGLAIAAMKRSQQYNQRRNVSARAWEMRVGKATTVIAVEKVVPVGASASGKQRAYCCASTHTHQPWKITEISVVDLCLSSRKR